jgi:hypothetical protein
MALRRSSLLLLGVLIAMLGVPASALAAGPVSNAACAVSAKPSSGR